MRVSDTMLHTTVLCMMRGASSDMLALSHVHMAAI